MSEPLRILGGHGGATAVYALKAAQWHRASGVTGVLYPFQNIAALTDLPRISRRSAFRPTLQTLAPSRSPHLSTKISLAYLCFFSFSLYLIVLISTVFCIFFCVRKTFCFLLKFRSVPDVTQSSSAMDWFVLCSVHYRAYS